jgi:exodeoxyribonuclease VII small subunit
MARRKNSTETEELSFEQALEEIEAITRALETGQQGLEESLRLYERGVALLRQCYERLRQVETRVEMLVGVDAEGRPITEPFPTREGEAVPLADPRTRNNSPGALDTDPAADRPD